MTGTSPPGIALGIADDADLHVVVLRVGEEAQRAGLDSTDCSRARTAAAELVTNILKYAGRGMLTVRRLEDGGRRGIELLAEDHGPGIPDLEAALRDHFSTSGTLGLGLPGVRRLMDEFDIRSTQGKGTTVRVRKWAS